MRPHFPRAFTTHERPAAVERRGSERSVAEALLGAGHPLVGLLGRFETAFEHMVWATAVQAAGLVLFAGQMAFGLSLAIAAAVVQLGLGCQVAALRTFRQEICLELIAAGHATLPLPCIERSCRRLLDGRTPGLLASSIDDMVATAARPSKPPAPRPLTEARVIRETAPELRQLASLLRADPAVRGVALVEWLLTSGATPLYGQEVEPLRQELRRASYLLTPHSEGESARSTRL
jgi:hypothetical protein